MRQKIIGMLPVLSVVILAALASREAHLARMGNPARDICGQNAT